MAAARKFSDKKRIAKEKGYFAVRIDPTVVGPTNPPRFPTELIRPIAAAAADSPSVRVGRTQKEGPAA